MDATTATTAEPVAARVVLKPRKAQPFYGRHPWVLAAAVDRVEPVDGKRDEAALDGQPVDLVTPQGAFIARGFYNSRSRLRVRLYSWSREQPLDAAFFRERLVSAIDLRRALGYEPPLDVDSAPTQCHPARVQRGGRAERPGAGSLWRVPRAAADRAGAGPAA